MPPKLKVYRAEIGGAHEWIVAAPSQKAAAAIWGTDTDVFAQGRGGPTTIPALVEAAMNDPGTPLRRVIGTRGPFKPIPRSGDVETWKLALQAEGLKPGKRPKPPPPPKAKKDAKPKKAEKPKKEAKPKPDRSALNAAEASLKAFEAEMKANERDRADEREALAARHAAAQKRDQEKHAALKDAVKAAERAYRLG